MAIATRPGITTYCSCREEGRRLMMSGATGGYLLGDSLVSGFGVSEHRRARSMLIATGRVQRHARGVGGGLETWPTIW